MTFFGDPLPLYLEGELSTGIDQPESVPFANRYPLRILIADDNYINRRVLFLSLQRLGYLPVTTDNGRECLSAALKDPYDVLLTDLEMPDMGGIECAQSIRKAGFKFPIVAVTASCPEMTREQCIAVGMNGFMAKPVQLIELKRLLREVALRKQALPPEPERPRNSSRNPLLTDSRATVRISVPMRRPAG